MKYLRLLLTSLFLSSLFVACAAPAFAADAESSDKGYEQKETVLTGKRILFVGDSICEAICERSNNRRDIMYGWASRIGEYNQMVWRTTGYGGASVSNCRGENTILKQLKLKQNASYDIVVLHGGVNDAWDSAPVGSLTNSFDPEDFNMSTFAGGLETTLQFAKETFPDALICYIINFRLPLATIGRLSNMNTYVKVTQKACDKWGVAYLDLYNNQELNEAMEVGTSTKYLPDHIHPNTAGYELLYPVIEEWLISLVSAQNEPVSGVESEPSVESSVSVISDDPASDPDGSEPAASPKNYTLIAAIGAGIALLVSLVLVLVFRKKRKTT